MTFHAYVGRFMEPKPARDFDDATEALRWFFAEAAKHCDDLHMTGEVYWTGPDGTKVHLVDVNTGTWRKNAREAAEPLPRATSPEAG